MSSSNGHATLETGASDADGARLRPVFARHYGGVCRRLRGMGVHAHSADDATQHAFLITLESLPDIVEGCERAFLYATAARIALGLRRKANREIGPDDPDRDSSPLPWPDDLVDQKHARELLDRLLGDMGADARAVFVLFEIEGFPVHEIAATLGIPQGTAASRLRRARKQFEALVRRHRNLASARA